MDDTVLTGRRTHISKTQVQIDRSTKAGLVTRNSSGDEIANVNFLYDDIVHALKMQ